MGRLTIQKGNPYNATITIRNSAGNPYDLTGKTVFFTVKSRNDHTDNDDASLITKDITEHTDEENGITVLELNTEQTDITVGDYRWDIRIYKADPLVQLNTKSGFCEIEDVTTKRIS